MYGDGDGGKHIDRMPKEDLDRENNLVEPASANGVCVSVLLY